MDTSTLIAAVDAQAHSLARETDFGGPLLVASPAAIEAAETTLGFPLPALLKRLYLEVGNGGFGPGDGLLGVPTGAPGETRETVLSAYAEQRAFGDEQRAWEPADGFPAMRWPKHLLPVCNWGCAIYSCVDCSDPAAPIVRLDPNAMDEDAETPEAIYQMVLLPEHASLAGWLGAWLDGEDLFFSLHAGYDQGAPHALPGGPTSASNGEQEE